jgi:flavin reductase (DIM6/NTAB) family NADH-FMN oxidoreductase RutF
MQIDLSRTLYATPPTGVTLISTLDKNGRNNIAPFAWWMIVSKEPPLVALSIKPITHTYRIIKDTAEFTLGVPGPELLDVVYRSANLDKEPDEFSQLGLTAAPALKINSPRIKECQVNMECRYKNEIMCGDHMLILGEVVAVDVRDDLVDKDDAIMRQNLKPLAHLTKNKFLTMTGSLIEASVDTAEK